RGRPPAATARAPRAGPDSGGGAGRRGGGAEPPPQRRPRGRPPPQPGRNERRGAALGPAYNVLPNSSNKLVPVPPAFLRYRPAPFLRPYNLSARQGSLASRARPAGGRVGRGGVMKTQSLIRSRVRSRRPPRWSAS